MSIFGITAVRLDNSGHIVSATITPIDAESKSPVGIPEDRDALEIASLIYKGDTVYSLFIDKGQSGTVPGPQFTYVVYPDGSEGIELQEDIPGRTVADLVQHSAWINTDQFSEVFRALKELRASLEKSCAEIAAAVKGIKGGT